MKAKFIESTNNFIFSTYRGLKGIFWISNGMAFLAKDQKGDESFRTSLIDHIEAKDNILVVKTLNSVYRFKIIEGKMQDLDLSSIQTYRDTFKKLKADIGKKSKFFLCQIGGNTLINNAISITELPEVMSVEEAREYLDNHVLLDTSGEIVINIAAPYFGNI